MNILEGIQEEQDRVREMIKHYEELPNGVGHLAASMMQRSLESSNKAIAEGDVVEMVRCYADLKEFKE